MFWTAFIQCDPNSVFFGFMGITSAIVFANLGAAYGTAKSGVGVSSVGVMRPDLIMRSILPVIMAGILGIYGLIISIVISSVIVLTLAPGLMSWVCLDATWNNVVFKTARLLLCCVAPAVGAPDVYSAYAGFGHLAGGLAVGLSSLAAGLAIGIVGDAGVRANAQQPKLFFGVTLILIFAEAIGLYGLIIALVIVTRKVEGLCTSYKGA